ncbi:MAG TPA: DUF3857 domain-containing protein, partial [Candidatus Polarisedimenticolia bacterium]|nr:DUF3857 domain-containing protein [Candidatus Polarisedimenticolia bacterium]
MKLARFCCAFLLAWSAPAMAGQPQTAPAPKASPPDSSHELFVVESIRSSMRFEADGTGARRIEMRVRVQAEGALQQLGQLVLNYNSDFERLTFTGRLRKPDGSAIEIPGSAIQDMSSPVSRFAPLYSDIRQKHVIVPGLRPGLTLEYEIQVEQFVAVSPGHFWTTYDFEQDDIVENEELSIDVPITKYVNVKSLPKFPPLVEEKDGRRVYRWRTS